MQMSIRRVDLELKCDSVYVPELIMHNITLMWDLSNQHPLAREALLAHEFRVEASNIILRSPETVDVEFDVQSQVCLKLLYSGTSKSIYLHSETCSCVPEFPRLMGKIYIFFICIVNYKNTTVVCDILHSSLRGYFIFAGKCDRSGSYNCCSITCGPE